MYNLEITAAFCDLNLGKNHALLGINLFHLKSGCVKFWTFRMSDANYTKLIDSIKHFNKTTSMWLFWNIVFIAYPDTDVFSVTPKIAMKT